MRLGHLMRAAGVAAIAVTALAAQAGCPPAWTAGTFGHLPGIDGAVNALASFDPDGPGPAPQMLVACGSFAKAGFASVANIAQWDGAAWSSLGTTWTPYGYGLNNAGNVMTILRSATGSSSLVVAGPFFSAGGVATFGVASWDGTSWAGFPSGPSVLALASVDEDGPGPAGDSLFAGGASGVSRWAGAAWTALPPPGGMVKAMTSSVDAASGLAGQLVVATIPNQFANGPSTVSRWDGSAWVPYGPAIPGIVDSLLVHDPDGPGPAPAELLAGGSPDGTTPGPLPFARWTGSQWNGVPLPCGVVGPGCSSDAQTQVRRLVQFDEDGAGPASPRVVIAGIRYPAPVLLGFAIAWDGVVFAPLPLSLAFDGAVNAVASFDPGSGIPQLFVAGTFTIAGSSAEQRIARWNGVEWTRAPTGPPQQGLPPDGASDAVVFDEDGPGPAPPALYVAGTFTIATPSGLARKIARWDGVSWSPVGAGSGPNWADAAVWIDCLEVFDEDGPGAGLPALFAGGRFFAFLGGPTVARYSGGAWSLLPAWSPQSFAIPTCVDLESFDGDGPGPGLPELFAGGAISGGSTAAVLHKWNSGGFWTSPGVIQASSPLAALATFDEDGPGPIPEALFVGGGLQSVNGVATPKIARWSGTAWSAAGTPQFTPTAFEVFDPDGPGPSSARLHAAARVAGSGSNFDGVYEWSGGFGPWTPIGLTAGDGVQTLGVHDPDGGGPAVPKLYAGGAFNFIGGTAAESVAAWDGAAWAPLGSGIAGGAAPPLVQGLCSMAEPWSADPGRPALYAVGNFAFAGGAGSYGVARWAVEPGLVLGFTDPANGQLLVQNSSCLPGQSYLSTFSVDPANAAYPGQGWWAGLHIDVVDVVSQYNLGAPPFVGILDATGASTFVLPADLVTALAGVTVWGVTRTYDPVLYVPLAASGVATWQF